jgi:hypothetical protein
MAININKDAIYPVLAPIIAGRMRRKTINIIRLITPTMASRIHRFIG